MRTEEKYLAKLKLQKKGLMLDLLTGKVRVKVLTINNQKYMIIQYHVRKENKYGKKKIYLLEG